MPEWITRKEAADMLGVSTRTIIRIAERHNIPAYKKEGNNKVLYKRQDLILFKRPRRKTNGS
jgi:excisionase family DNA binding protein|nr:helix-turn-helix domain-containing protein [uncultured Actinomyces sp.]DAE91083.1 MAG TPA: helix-turn-helix domain protein [Caudoviricetes sp.]